MQIKDLTTNVEILWSAATLNLQGSCCFARDLAIYSLDLDTNASDCYVLNYEFCYLQRRRPDTATLYGFARSSPHNRHWS